MSVVNLNSSFEKGWENLCIFEQLVRDPYGEYFEIRILCEDVLIPRAKVCAFEKVVELVEKFQHLKGNSSEVSDISDSLVEWNQTNREKKISASIAKSEKREQKEESGIIFLKKNFVLSESGLRRQYRIAVKLSIHCSGIDLTNIKKFVSEAIAFKRENRGFHMLRSLYSCDLGKKITIQPHTVYQDPLFEAERKESVSEPLKLGILMAPPPEAPLEYSPYSHSDSKENMQYLMVPTRKDIPERMFESFRQIKVTFANKSVRRYRLFCRQHEEKVLQEKLNSFRQQVLTIVDMISESEILNKINQENRSDGTYVELKVIKCSALA